MEKHSIIPRVADAQEPEQPAARANFPERRFPVTTRRGHSTDSPDASCSPMIWPGSICRWQTFYRAIKSLQTMCRGRGEAKIDLFPVRVFSHPARRGGLPGWLLTFVVVILKNNWFWLIAWFSLYITTLLMWHVDEYKQSALLTNTVSFLDWYDFWNFYNFQRQLAEICHLSSRPGWHWNAKPARFSDISELFLATFAKSRGLCTIEISHIISYVLSYEFGPATLLKFNRCFIYSKQINLRYFKP